MSTVSTERGPLPGVEARTRPALGQPAKVPRRRRSQDGEGPKDVVAFDAQEFVDAPCCRQSEAPGRPGT